MEERLKCHTEWRKPNPKDHVLDDFIYTRCPEQANPQGQCVSGCQGLGSPEWGVTTNGCGVSFRVMEMFWV